MLEQNSGRTDNANSDAEESHESLLGDARRKTGIGNRERSEISSQITDEKCGVYFWHSDPSRFGHWCLHVGLRPVRRSTAQATG